MLVGECCKDSVVVATRDTGISEAARLMREHHVGTLVVVAEAGHPHHPIGVVTDRDLVIEVLAQGVAPGSITIGDIMSPKLLSADVEDGLWTTLARMCEHGVRRLPVVDRNNILRGILSIDDILQQLIRAQDEIVGLMRSEVRIEAKQRPSKP